MRVLRVRLYRVSKQLSSCSGETWRLACLARNDHSTRTLRMKDGSLFLQALLCLNYLLLVLLNGTSYLSIRIVMISH